MGYSPWGRKESDTTEQLNNVGLIALQHAESSRISYQTRTSCTGRWILHPWATREALFCPPLSDAVPEDKGVPATEGQLVVFGGLHSSDESELLVKGHGGSPLVPSAVRLETPLIERETPRNSGLESVLL